MCSVPADRSSALTTDHMCLFVGRLRLGDYRFVRWGAEPAPRARNTDSSKSTCTWTLFNLRAEDQVLHATYYVDILPRPLADPELVRAAYIGEDGGICMIGGRGRGYVIDMVM